jgi:hypothetical protein
MRIGTIVVPALALLVVAAGDEVRAQQRPHATPQAQAPQQGGTQEPRRLGRSYPMAPPPIPQREAPGFYVATPQASSIHRGVGGSRNDGNRTGDATGRRTR